MKENCYLCTDKMVASEEQIVSIIKERIMIIDRSEYTVSWYCFRDTQQSNQSSPSNSTISAGVTIKDLTGKCLILPVTRYAFSLEIAIS